MKKLSKKCKYCKKELDEHLMSCCPECFDKKVIERQRKNVAEIQPKQVSREWVEVKTNEMEQMVMQKNTRKDREYFIKKLYEDKGIEVAE